ncbi:sensor histidine kinase [Actinospica sp.]|jgi:signal transduction histidine kinase|uniref:sensor histidine kinase n=1 Tax=Actinospica sp. TaxID=1872142 RepID=UPI002C6695B2|nr:sensor histidine kinase [Actinospica sp.]HWG28625.1 sensor histidine kinase [Actinospica sp.]
MAVSRIDGRLRHRWDRDRLASAVRAWLRRRQAVVDVLVVLVFAAVAVGRISAEQRPVATAVWILAFAGFVPLGFRRLAPVAVFAAVTAIAVAGLAVGSDQAAPMLFVALLAALYSLAASRPRRLALVGAAVFELWAGIAFFVWAPHDFYLPSIVLMTGTALAALMTGFNHQTRRAYLAALEDRAARLERERDQQARLAVAQERTRIAREVHDIVSHSLSVMIALADGAAAVTAITPDRAADAMRQTARTGRDAIGEMRRMVGALRTEEPAADRHPQPGIAQLDALLDEVREAGLPSRLIVEHDLGHLPVGAQLAIYRIVQESLTNIRKHADGATAACVRLSRSDGAVDVEITDDGRPGGVRATDSGHGIVGMRERAAAYGGSIEAGPGPHGWRVHARMYLDEAEEPR